MRTCTADFKRADLIVTAAAIYERKPRIWIGEAWICPQCRKYNDGAITQCSCLISRDGLPEFGGPTVLHYSESMPPSPEGIESILLGNQPFFQNDFGDDAGLLKALIVSALPCLLIWAGVIKLSSTLFK